MLHYYIIIAFLLKNIHLPPSETKNWNAIHLPSIHRYDFPGPFEGMESAGTASPQLRLFMAN